MRKEEEREEREGKAGDRKRNVCKEKVLNKKKEKCLIAKEKRKLGERMGRKS